MRVRIADREGDFQVEREETFTSISTGRQLRRFDTEVTFTAPRDDDVINALDDDEARMVALLDNGEEVPCSSKVLSSSYTEGDDRRFYRVELQEIEPLNLAKLVLAGHELEPMKYEEETRHDVLTCHVRARVPKETLTGFWALRGSSEGDEYFDVIRHGIADEPRQMRFGRILWKQLADEAIEASFVLVDKAYDDDPKNRLRIHGPNEAAVQEAVAKLEVLVERLLDKLGERSVMAAEDIDTVRSVAADVTYQHEMNFYKVDDLDKWE